MTQLNKQDQERHVIKRYTEEGCFTALEDGFWYFWPKGAGAIPSWHLRAIADHLDNKNRKWERKIGWFLWWGAWKRMFSSRYTSESEQT